jgi:hypothetical protein
MTRSGVFRQTAVASILGTFVLTACNASTPTSPTTTTVARGAAKSSVDHLRLTIFDRLPASFIEEPAGSNLDGPLNLIETATAVDDQETAIQEAILRQYGFRTAYQRTWTISGTGETLIIRVQDMGSPMKALGYFNFLTYTSRLLGQLTSFPTPQLADASGFSRSFTESTGPQVAQDISLARGRLYYHLIFTGPQGTVSPSDILTIARSQSTQAVSLGFT